MQQFTITGMTCVMCEAAVIKQLKEIASVTSVSASYKTKSVTIEASQTIDLLAVQESISKLKRYKAEEYVDRQATTTIHKLITIYKPLLIIFAFLIGVSFITSFHSHVFKWEHFRMKMFLHSFMTAFFIVFSFFKLLDIPAFAKSFRQYDLIAKYIPSYADQYPFIELSIGVACLMNYDLQSIYISEICLMAVGLVGIVRSNLQGRKIQCACLGTVFSLPMSKIAIIENSTMILVGLALLTIK